MYGAKRGTFLVLAYLRAFRDMQQFWLFGPIVARAGDSQQHLPRNAPFAFSLNGAQQESLGQGPRYGLPLSH
jgi:hypothetical protein